MCGERAGGQRSHAFQSYEKGDDRQVKLYSGEGKEARGAGGDCGDEAATTAREVENASVTTHCTAAKYGKQRPSVQGRG